MDLQLQRQGGVSREIDWFAAGVAGFAAGALMMVLELTWAASMSSDGPWRITQLIAALTLGSESTLSVAPSKFNLANTAAALVTHYALGIFSGFVLAWILTLMHRVGKLGVAEAVGAAFGAVIYVVNFHLLTAVAPWFIELRGWATFMLNVIFGIVAAALYSRLSRLAKDAEDKR